MLTYELHIIKINSFIFLKLFIGKVPIMTKVC